MAFVSFHPPARTLMGPGPSDIHPRVLAALSRPTLGHLDPEFIGMMDEVKELLRYAFQTTNEITFPVSAPGSAGMECCFVNLVEPGDKVVVCQNGVFGGRMKENAERCGGTAVMVQDDWGTPVDPHKLEDALKANPDAKIVAFVHAETSTGVRSDAETLVNIAHAHECLTIMDTVTGLGGIPVRVDDWGADAVYSGTQKCLSCTPGVSPVTFGARAIAKVKQRASTVQSWFLDLNLVMSYWGGDGKRAYHHTAPIHALYALHEALVMLREEGLETAWQRHDRNHQALRAGLEAMGLSIIVDEKYRLPQLNAVSVPEGVDEAAVRERLLKDYSLEIGAGLGALAGMIWRVGLMGYASNCRNVLLFLGALDAILHELGAGTPHGTAVGAAAGKYRALLP
jgi:alanine-glyoxylate transaminase / serine-glyoxylate transaminase / serine-pyruvate transaminase